MQKLLQRFFVLVLASILLSSTTIMAFASETNPAVENNSSYIITDEDGVLYAMYEEDGILVISELYTERFGGGIGRCPASGYKTFSYAITKEQARAANRVITIGEGCVKSINTLLTSIAGWPGIAASLVLDFLGGDSLYQSNLKSFINSSSSAAHITIIGKCVNRGYMYGDPMYDYVVERMSFTW